VGNYFFLQGIFLTQGSNTGLLHCRQILYHQGSVVYWACFIWNTNPAVTGWCSKWYWDVGNKHAVSSSCLLIKRLHWDVRTPTEMLGMWKTLCVYVCLPPPSEWLFFLLNVEQVVGENSSAPIYYPALAFQGKEFRGIAKGLDVYSESELTQQGRYPVVMLGSWRSLVSGTSFTDREIEVLGAPGLPLRWQLSQLLTHLWWWHVSHHHTRILSSIRSQTPQALFLCWVHLCFLCDPTNVGNQPWIFLGRTDAKAPILWPLDAKSRLIGKDPDAGNHWRQKEKGLTEDEMASLTQWPWIWANSGRWWRTGEPGMLQSMGSWRVEHDLVTKQQHLCMSPASCIGFVSPACDKSDVLWWLHKAHGDRYQWAFLRFSPGSLDAV